MRKLSVLFITFLLVSCQPSIKHSLGGVHDSSNINLLEVVNSLKDHGVDLVEEAPEEKNEFGQKLKGIIPTRYTLDDKNIFIFIFTSADERKEGEAEFVAKTSDKKLVSYHSFTNRNVLIFYVHEEDTQSKTIHYKDTIRKSLTSIMEG